MGRWPNRTLFILAFFIGGVTGSVARAVDNASVVVEASTREMTPGQQFELRLTVSHDEDVDAVFNPRQQPWEHLEFIDYQIIEPRWHQQQWVSVYILQVAATLAGSYQLPTLRVSFFRGADHWNLETAPLPYEVVSLFLGSPEIQPLLSLPDSLFQRVTPPAYANPLFLWVVLPLLLVLLVLLLFGRHFGLRRLKPVRLWNRSLTSPEVLARQSLHDGVIDWESLRMWLIVESGSDPLGRLTSQETLLHQYQQVRFTQGTDREAYAGLCRLCQERWG